MAAVAWFWLLLGLPGYAFLRRFRPDVLDGGLPSNVALSYLATLTLLSPISVAGYLLHLPVAVLSITVVLSVLGAAIWLLRTRIVPIPWPIRRPVRWPIDWSKVSPIALVVSALVACDLILGIRSGSYLKGDAAYHVARVRMLLDYGFNSWDPVVYGLRFEPIYHTNLYHALMAVACQLTMRPPPAVWVATLFWAKLVTVVSTYHLARVLLGARWLGWTAAGLFTVWMAPSPLLTVPHNVAAYFLLALGLAFALEVLEGQRGLLPVMGLAAAALVLPQFHALCYVFLVFTAAPVMLGALARAQLRRLPGRKTLLFGLFALGLGVPWFAPHIWERANRLATEWAATSAQGSQGAPSSTGGEAMIPPRDAPLMYRGFTQLSDNLRMFDPAPLKDPANETTQLLVALLAGFFGTRRRQFLRLAAMSGVILALLYFPPLCTLALAVTERGWIVARFGGVLSCLHFAAFPGALLLLAERLAALAPRVSPPVRRLLARTFKPFAVTATLVYGLTVPLPPWSVVGYWYKALNRPQRKELRDLARHQSLLRENVPAGSVLAADPSYWYMLGMACDCFPLALPANRGDYGIPDMAQRRRDLATLTELGPDLRERVEVARHYGIRYVFLHHTGRPSVQRIEEVYAPITAKVIKTRATALLILAPERFDSASADR